MIDAPKLKFTLKSLKALLNDEPPKDMSREKQLEEMVANATSMKWNRDEEGMFTPTRPQAELLEKLPAGAYEFGFSMFGPYAKLMNLKDEELIPFKGGAVPVLMQEIERFWSLEDRYVKLGVPYRRGILMHGVPGTGKSGIVRLVCDKIIENDGLVAYCQNAGTFVQWLPILNKMDPKRKMVIVFEDIDNLVDYDEHGFLQLLDGISNDRPGMLFIATTNFLNNIPERIYRPSRFDLLIEVGAPDAGVRREYVQRLCNKYEIEMREDIVEKSEGLAFAHLKEILVSCLLFDRTVDEMVERMSLHGSMLNDEDDD